MKWTVFLFQFYRSSGDDYHYDACKGVACDGGKCGNDVCVVS